MTVCIGVISQPMVIVATDRMITSGDIQFEQQQPKIFNVAYNTLALISGDIAVQTALVDSTRAAAKKAGVKTTKQVAEIFADAYASYCQRKAEAEILKPLGLASVSELMSKRKWSTAVVDELLRQVQYSAHHDDVGTIIAGQDETGPHLYVIDKPGMFSVHDRIGFASVGIGQRHAESQFMFAGYTPQWTFPRALYLTYVAKRRAEVAPGVGKYTDIAVITTGPNANIVPLDSVFLPVLEAVYEEESAAVSARRPESEAKLDEAIKRILNIPPQALAPQNPALNSATPSGLPATPTASGPQAPQDSTRDQKDPPPSPE